MIDLTPCRKAFGRPDAESESEALQADYEALFFEGTPFNAPALRTETYLIRGRRGSGKSALACYFGFQKVLADSTCLLLSEKRLSQGLILRLADLAKDAGLRRPGSLARAWDLVFWSLVFIHLQDRHPDILKGQKLVTAGNAAHTADEFISKLVSAAENATSEYQNFWRLVESKDSQPNFTAAKKVSLATTARNPLIIAFDTAEHYDVRDTDVMNSFAALVEAASNLNFRHAASGIHLKVFLPDESYNSLRTEYVSNPTKYIHDEVLLHWRPKDLLRLVCYRLSHFMTRHPDIADAIGFDPKDVDYSDFASVKSRIWDAFFGSKVISRTKDVEDTWIYVLRHTQLRPRQVILLCNAVVSAALDAEEFPRFTDRVFQQGIEKGEIDLAEEVVNSYSKVFKNADEILACLGQGPATLSGRDLHIAAQRAARYWEEKGDVRSNFVDMLVQLGAIGVVRNDGTKAIEADFQYNMDHKLYIQENSFCAVHPMFCHKLGRRRAEGSPVVLPFPNRVGYEAH